MGVVTARATTLTIPEDAGGSKIHIVLEVQDRSKIVPLYDYRRIVVTVARAGD